MYHYLHRPWYMKQNLLPHLARTLRCAINVYGILALLFVFPNANTYLYSCILSCVAIHLICEYLLIKFRIIDVKYKNSKNKRRTPLEIYEINHNISSGIRAHFCYSSSSASPSSSGSGSGSGVSTLAFAFASIPASSNGYKNDAIC